MDFSEARLQLRSVKCSIKQKKLSAQGRSWCEVREGPFVVSPLQEALRVGLVSSIGDPRTDLSHFKLRKFAVCLSGDASTLSSYTMCKTVDIKRTSGRRLAGGAAVRETL